MRIFIIHASPNQERKLFMKINSNMTQNHGEYGVKNNRQAEHISDRKYMERVARGENVNLFQELGKGVSVELSEEGLAQLNKKLAEIKNDRPDMRILTDEEKASLLKEAIKPLRSRHPIIPNIQTNDKLVKGLAGADENVVDAAYSIIQKNLLPHNVGTLTEQERQELILVGLEQAKYLADGLDQDKAGLFMEAMNTIAQYGINGKPDQQGNVTYDIRWGALVGAPDDYISTGDLMKRVAPEEYAKYSSMMEEGIRKNDNRLQMDAIKYMLDWEIQSYRKNPKPIEEEKQKQADWKKNVDNTKIPDTYSHTDRSTLQTLTESILRQNQVLDYDFLSENLREFAKILLGTEK